MKIPELKTIITEWKEKKRKSLDELDSNFKMTSDRISNSKINQQKRSIRNQ